MIRSFLNAFLSEDEYKRERILYFLAETAVITIVMLLLIGFGKYIFKVPYLDTELLLLLGPFLMMAYPFLRYILSGIEHTEITNQQDYQRQLRIGFLRSVIFGVVFGLILFIVKGIPKSMSEGIELIVVPILFIIFYFLSEWISLKRSYRKNKELE